MKIFGFSKKYIPSIILILILVYIQVLTDLQLPDFMSTIIDEGIVGQNLNVIYDIGIKMLLTALAGAACTILVGLLSARVGAGYAANLREAVFTKVEGLSLAEFNSFSTSSLITRTTNDIQQIQMVTVMSLRIVISAPIMGIGAVSKAISKSPSMAWILTSAVVIIIILMIIAFNIAMPKFKLLQKLVDRLNLVTRERLTGLRVIRAFNTEKTEEEKFKNVNKDLYNVNLFVNKIASLLQPLMTLIINIVTISIIWVGSHLIDLGKLEIGNMMAFIQYAMQIIMSFLMLSFIFIFYPRASVSAERISEVLSVKPLIKDPENKIKQNTKLRGLVEFKNVTFYYPGADTPTLENITFTAKPGEITAFIGSTGSGKSTLINLIPRFYDIQQGQILVDGIDVRDYKQKDLRSKIGYVPQRGILFSGTVESNIKYGNPDASNEEMINAAEVAQAAGFINEFPEKYQNHISQGGTNVSGGQRQRLSIARALLIHPEIYIFDDSFSALDYKTDALLRAALYKEIKKYNSTAIIVAARISTIRNAHQIIVLDEGKIVGKGTHSELMKNCEVYKEIALSQLSGEELE